MSQSGQAGRFAGGGGIIQTINGDTGSITGPIVTIYANNAANGAGANVKFTNSGTVSTLTFTDPSGDNLYLGRAAGTPGFTGNFNVGIGVLSLASVNGALYNTAVGVNTGNLLTLAGSNSFFGYSAGQFLLTGSGNTLLGKFAGLTYTSSESDNICISNNGVVSDSKVIRIGTQGSSSGQQNTCYIAGIIGVTNSNAQLVTINSSTGQLGVTTSIVSSGNDVTSATQQLAVGQGYVTDRGGGVVYTLPATATFWDQIIITGKAGISTITPNANQQILIGAASGSIGPGGTATATNAGDCIILRCITGGASSVWRAEAYVGNWTLI